MSYTDEYLKALEEEEKKKKKKNTSANTQTKKTQNTQAKKTQNTQSTNAKKDDDFTSAYLKALEKENAKNDDIAPVAVSKSGREYSGSGGKFDVAPEKEEKDSWVKGGAFDDGYRFGDVTKTVYGTAGDIVTGAVKGVGRMVEGLVDLGTYGVAEVGDLFGADEFAEKTKKVARYSATDKWTKGVTDHFDQYSVIGNKGDMISEGLGQVGAIILTGGLAGAASGSAAVATAVTTGATGLSSMGTNMGQAYDAGATDGEAFVYGLTTGAIEAGTELLFGGLGKGVKALGISRGIGGLDDMFAKKLSSKVAKAVTNESVQKIIGNSVEFAVKSGGEGFEEVLSGLGSAVMKKLTYEDDETLKKLIADENLLEQYVVGTITSSIVQGGDFVKANKSGTDFVTGHTSNEEKVINKVVEKEIAEREANGEKLTTKDKNAIYDTVVENMEKGGIGIDTIEEILGGESYEAYKTATDESESLKKERDELNKIKTMELTGEQSDRLAELKGMNLDDTTNTDTLKKKVSDDVFNLVKNDRDGKGSILLESYREVERRRQAFTADLTKYEGKQREAIERAINSGVLNNTNRAHALVSFLSEIEAEKDIIFDYTDNKKLKESGFALDGKTVNGYVKDGKVVLNMQSAKAWESTVGHEITHVLEGTTAYGELQSALFKYAESKGELATRRAELTKLYEGIENANIDAELTADLVGDYLFSDKSFINHLTSNRNVFQKVYDEIKYLWNVATGKEKAQIEKVKREFDRVWKELSTKGIDENIDDSNVKYSIREEAPPKETGIAYKVFFVKDGKLYPPMVANPDGADTPMGVWLNADVGTAAPPSKTGRAQVKAGGKGTQGGSGSLAFRPGWHLGDLPRASQFDRVNPETGKKELFPENFVWAEVEYAKDVDYQEEAMSYGYTENGKFRHAYAGLPKLPENGYYRYRTNPKPDTVPWVITGAMKVNRLLSDAEVNEILEKNGVPAIHRQGGDVGLDKFGFDEGGKVKYSVSQEGIDNNQEMVYNGKRGETYVTTDEFRSLQAESQRMSDEDTKLYHSGSKQLDDEVRGRLSRAFGLEIRSANSKRIYSIRTLLNPKTNKEVNIYEGVDGALFHDCFEISRKYLRNGELVDLHEVKTTEDGIGYDDCENYLSEDGLSGFSITPDGDLISVFNVNAEKGFLKTIAPIVREKAKTLDCYASPNQNLMAMYEKIFGFKAASVMDYNMEYDHDDIAENHGMPKIAFMVNTERNVETKQFTKDEYDEAVEYRNKFVSSLEESKKSINYSISTDSNGNELSLAVQKRFANSKAVDENGNLKVLYHGTASGEFYTFDKSKGSVEGDFGSGFYFTDNKADVKNNYEGGGADFEIKVARLAEQIESEEDISYGEARKRAKAELYKGSFKHTVYLNIEKPAVVGETYLFDYESYAENYDREDYDSDEDYEGDVEQLIADDIDQILWDIEQNIDIYSTDGIPEVLWNAVNEGGIGIEQLKAQINELYLEDNSGNMVGNEVTRQIIESLGYDGIIDNTVSTKFNMGLDEGTTHYIVFKPNQIKSIDNHNPTDNPDIRKSLSYEGEKSTFGTPLKDMYREQDVAPVAEQVTEKVPIAENATTTSEAPMPSNSTPLSTRIADGTRGDELLNDSLKNYPMETMEQKVAEKIRSVEGELNDNRELRKEAQADYDEKIGKLKAQYNAKKDKTTIVANNILQSISRLEGLKARADADYAKRISDLEARLEKMKDPKYVRALYRKAKMEEHAKYAEELVGDTSTWVDKKLGLQYAVNTERRNLRDIIKDENGNADIKKADRINDALNGQYNREEAEKKRELAKVRGKYADMKITKAEDAYAQMLGELRHNPKTTLTDKVVNEYYEQHKGKIDKAKVEKIIELARKDYDDLFMRVNEALRKQGMREIPYRKGYFPHFTDTKQNFIQKLFNWKTQDNEIPTSIAGLTEAFKPVKSWQAFDKTRHGDETDYSFMKGFDSYSDGALDWIHHLDTLQKRRAVENHIRFTHSDEGIQARIKEVYASEEYDATEAQAQIEHILSEANNPLNNFIQDFTTHTNILAGKKNSLDRTVEQLVNRKIYSVMQNVQNRTSANMVLANIRSAMTNFIPLTQSWAQVSPLRSLQAVKDTIANTFKDDGMIDKSTFLTNRLREVDNLYQTNWDKVLDKAGIMFEIVDNFSSQVIWRSKYKQNIAKGMSEGVAIANADQFAENVMAGRSKGNEPTLFSAKNPLVKAFTMFQLEVNNQYGYLFKDVPNDLKTEANHWKTKYAVGLTTAFVGAYYYNELFKMVAGSKAAFDPIGIIKDLLRDLGLFDDDEEKEPKEVVTNLVDNVVGELPFVGGLFGGGRIPISSALPYGGEYGGGLTGAIEDVTEGNWKNIGKEMMKPIMNVALPVGGGQIKKTYQGLKMFNTDEDHPITGSYTDSGSLRFPVEDTTWNRIQAGLFGQYASANAREYFDNGYAPLKEKQIQEYQDVELPISDYWKYREGLSGLKTNEAKAEYINGLDIEDWQKNLLMNNILDRKNDVDMTNYDDYGSWEEFDYAQKNPEKYDFFKANGISYSDYANADEDGKNAYTWAYNNPEKYTLSKAVADDVITYRSYSGELYDIKADKDANGKSINGSRKEKVIDYLNKLDASYETKIILFKTEYPSDDTYNNEIIEYLNNRGDLTYDELVTIYSELGFTIKDGYVYW